MRRAVLGSSQSSRKLPRMSDFFPEDQYPGIFATHQWVDAWEQSWADCEKIVRIKKHINEENCRDGIYTHRHISRYGYSLTTAFSAGISTPASPSLRSEYFNLQENNVQHFVDAALGYSWDQFYIPDLIQSSAEYSKLRDYAITKKLSVIVREQSKSYAVSLNGSCFDDYVKSLSGNARVKLFNKRKNLYSRGNILIANLWPDVDKFIDLLNQFHIERWGKPCYENRNRKQITYFLNEIVCAGGTPDLSVIYCNGKPISLVLDLEYKGRIYNIQSGYLEKFQNGISLGTLHFGFQLEKAFSSGASFYDFMAGKGKNSDYKKALATHKEDLVTIMIVRGFFLKALYTFKDIVCRFEFKE